MKTEEQRFEDLYLEGVEKVRTYVRKKITDRELTEDIVQEVFCVAWKKRQEFTASGNPMGWLIRAARFKMLEQYHNTGGGGRSSLEEYEEEVGITEPGYEMAEWMEILEGLLDQYSFRIFQDYFLHGYTMKEIAQQKGMKENNLRVQLHRMRKRLHGQLGKKDKNK